jgi:hypothetical protein
MEGAVTSTRYSTSPSVRLAVVTSLSTPCTTTTTALGFGTKGTRDAVEHELAPLEGASDAPPQTKFVPAGLDVDVVALTGIRVIENLSMFARSCGDVPMLPTQRQRPMAVQSLQTAVPYPSRPPLYRCTLLSSVHAVESMLFAEDARDKR